MKRSQRVSAAVVKRLPKYYRYLQMISKKGIIRVSSQELSDITGLTASQIRQDLNHFGGFGQQGYGYNVEELKAAIEEIIGIDKNYNAIVLGFGNLGRAIYRYAGYHDTGFNMIGIFDSDEEVIGIDENGLTVRDIKDISSFLVEEEVQIAILTTPKSVAQELADILVEGGVKGIWNFASLDLDLPDDVILENVHLDESLYTLIYYINNPNDYPGSK